MDRLSETIPSFVQGMTQQPPELRNPLKGDLQINMIPDPARGLCKRAGTRWLRNAFSPALGYRPFVHKITREGERYFVTIGRNNTGDPLVRVYDPAGTSYTVNTTPAAIAYIGTTSPDTSLDAVTLSDTVVLINREKTVALTSAQDAAPLPRAIVWVKRGNYATLYQIKVTISGTSYTASYTTPNGTVGTDITALRTNAIASSLAGALAGAGAPALVVDYDANSSQFTVRRTGDLDFDIEVVDSAANGAIGLCKGQVPRFSDLPPLAPAGFKVKVLGSVDEDVDDYWVEFDPLRTGVSTNIANEKARRGSWIETRAPLTKYELDAATMPVRLTREIDGTFTLAVVTWENRLVGDDKMVRQPSFVGKKITGVALFRNRLCFLSNGNVIMSGSGDLFNFWRTTGLQVLDSDPIDVSLPTGDAFDFRHMVPLAESALLVASRAQMIITADGALTPSTITATIAANYEVDTTVKPIVLGQFAHLAYTGPNGFGGVRTFAIEGDARVRVSEDASLEVPRLIAGGVADLDGDSTRNTLLVLSKNNELFIYKWLDVGRGQRAQSAWGQLDFGASTPVRGMAVMDGNALLLLERPEAEYSDGSEGSDIPLFTSFELLPIDFDTQLGSTLLHIDKAGVYTSVNIDGSTSYIDLPFVPGTTTQVFKFGPADQVTFTRDKVIPNRIIVDGPAGTYAVGVQLYCLYRSGPAVIMSQTPVGGSAPTQGPRIQVISYSVKACDSGPFVLRVWRPVRGIVNTKSINPTTLSLFSTNSETVDHEGTVFTLYRSENCRLEIFSDGPLPLRIQAGRWEGVRTFDARTI
jgi:hypothetical protein